MSEYELTYLHSELQGAGIAMFMDAMSIVSAFLIAGYFAAHRLNRVMVGVVVALYSYTMWNMTLLLSKAVVAAMGVEGQIRAFAAAGKGMQWHPAVRLPQPDWAPDWALTIVSIEFGIVYLGSLMFFFYCRKQNRSSTGQTLE